MTGRFFRSRRGMTLAETLTALAVFAILAAALARGTEAAWSVWREAVTAGEARTLRSTLVQALSDTLRYSRDIRTEEGTVIFDSDAFGEDVSVLSSGGRVRIGKGENDAWELLPEKAYTGGLEAEAAVSYRDGVFTLEITIRHPLMRSGWTSTHAVQAMNP